MGSENHVLVIEYENEPEQIQIQWIHDQNKKGEFDKIFDMTLLDIESDYFEIPEVDYYAEFSINSKKINEIMTQLSNFGDVMNIKCNDEKVTLNSNGLNGTMSVHISVDDLTEYSIVEESSEELNLFFGLNYVQKMCIHTKLSNEIGFCLGNNLPMKINYDLGKNSHCVFYLAPKSDD
jgi:proliferating cell nuclear antigen PCNA